jgi:hypothetical protein
MYTRNSNLYEGYHLPGDGRHEVHDEMLHKRLGSLPTPNLRQQYEKVQAAAAQHGGPQPVIDAFQEILSSRDLPTIVRMTIQAFIADPTLKKFGAAIRAIEASVERIFFATIASFLHPNEKGATRIADRIVLACRGGFSARRLMTEMHAVSLRATMQSLGLPLSLRRLADVSTIRSVGIKFDRLRPTADPAVATATLGDGLVFALEPPVRGTQDFLCTFEARDISIAKVTAIVVNGLAVFDRLTVYLNGTTFFTAPYPPGRHQSGGTVHFPL